MHQFYLKKPVSPFAAAAGCGRVGDRSLRPFSETTTMATTTTTITTTTTTTTTTTGVWAC